MALFWGWEPTVSEDTDDPPAWTDMVGSPVAPVATDEAEGGGADLLAAAAAADHWGKESGGFGAGGPRTARTWTPMTSDDTDAEGWKYGTSFHRLDAPREGGRGEEKSSDVVRRRCWACR